MTDFITNKLKRITAGLAAIMLAAFFTAGVFGCGRAPSDENALPVLTIASDEYQPYFYVGESGEYAGIDVELAVEACRRMGYKAKFVRIRWTEKDDVLARGEADCLWGSFSMTGREDKYLWAGPYMTSRQVVGVEKNSDIKTLADLAGKRVGVQMAFKPDEIFSKREDIDELYCYSDMTLVFAALRKGYVDAIAGHETAVLEFMKAGAERADSSRFRILDETLLSVNLGVAFARGRSDGLAEKLTAALAEMRSDGFVADVLTRYGLDPARAEIGEGTV